MALYNYDGNLIHNAGSLAGHSDCCCDECVCDLPKAPFGDCQCLDGDYGSILTPGDATIVITGTMTPKPPSGLIGSCATPSVCAAPTGTFVLPCDTCEVWQIWTFVCSDFTTWDYYYAVMLRVSHTANGFSAVHSVSAQVVSQLGIVAMGSGNPYSGLTKTSPPAACSISLITTFIRRTWSWSSTATYADYVYELSGDCTADCNEDRTGLACTSAGSKTWDSDVTDGGGGTDYCDPVGLTATLSFAAAS